MNRIVAGRVRLAILSPSLTPQTRAYIVLISAAGALILVRETGLSTRDPLGFAVFLVLGGLAQLMTLRFYQDASVSMAMSMALATILVFGPAFAVWVNVASGVVHYLTQIRPKKRPFYRSAVTTAVLVIAAWLAGEVYVLTGGQVGADANYLGSLISISLAGLVYYLANTILITAAMALEQRKSFRMLLQINYRWLIVNVASLTPLAVGAALIYAKIGFTGLAAFLIPIAMARYSFQLYARSMENIQRVNADLKQANERVNKANDDLKQANERVQNTNEALTKANERLNIMYEISRSLVGSLHVDETSSRIQSATQLMGFPAGLVVGPLLDEGGMPSGWCANHPAYAQWSSDSSEEKRPSALAERLSGVPLEDWFRKGEPIVAEAATFGLHTSVEASDGGPQPPSTLTLLPLTVQGRSWGLVGVGSAAAPSPIEMKELLIFRSLAENALEMALAHEKAERDALIDARTGLYNHRYFQEALQRELQEAMQRNSFLSLLMIDINKFKHLNDDYGHLVGDQVLSIVGQLLRDNVRAGDIACRYGGDEMCVLMPHTDRPRAMEIASRIDGAIKSYCFRIRQGEAGPRDRAAELSLRVSIGVATFPEAGNTRAGLVEQADRGCYRAKALGGGVAAEEPRHAAAADHPRLQVVK